MTLLAAVAFGLVFALLAIPFVGMRRLMEVVW